MGQSRNIPACTGAIALWIVFLMGGAQDLALSSAASSRSLGQESTSLHSASSSSALLPQSEHLPVVGDLRLSGNADGEESSGRASVTASSSALSFPLFDRLPRPGRTPLFIERSCPMLCVFLC